MRCLGQLTGLSLVLIFMMVFPCSMWTFNTQRIALRGDTYKDVFADEGFYQELIPVVLPALIEGRYEAEILALGEISLGQAVDNLDQRDWERIAPDLVPADWVKREVETNLDAYFGWQEGERDDLVLIFHTGVIRSRMLGPSGDHAVQQIIDALPPCTPAESEAFAQFVDDGRSDFTYCRPADADLQARLHEKLLAAKDRVANDLPTELNIVEEMEAHTPQANGSRDTYSRVELNEFRATIRLWQRLLVLVFLIPAAMLALVVIFSVRSAKSFFRWMGWPLIVASLFTLVPLLFLPLMMSDVTTRSQGELEEGLATGGALVSEILVNGMMRLVVGEFTRPILFQSAILITVGFVCLVLSVLLPDPDAPPEFEAVSPYPMPVYQPVSPESFTRLEHTPPPDHTPPTAGQRSG